MKEEIEEAKKQQRGYPEYIEHLEKQLQTVRLEEDEGVWRVWSSRHY